MSNILFPDVWGTIGKVAAIENADAQRNFLTQERDAKASAAPFVQKALQGDRDALNEVATRHPDTAMKLAPLFDRMDAAQRTKAKDAAEFTASGANAILQADPADRPAIYAQILADGKSRGFDLSKLPPQYTPQLDPQLRTYRSMAIPMLEHFKNSGEGVQFAPPAGGGPAPAGGGVNPNNIGNVRPVGGGPSAGFQQPATFDDGVRLAVNNVKAYPAKFNNGQPMTLMQIGQRWAPAGDGANDPNQWAKNVASIGGLDPNKPLDLNDPATAAAFARGVHGAEHGAGKAQPVEAYARILAGGAPQGMPQGDGGPPGSPAGAGPQEPPPALAPLRGLQLPPGARVALQKGVPIVKDGAVLYIDAQGGWGAAPLPKPKEQTIPAGYEPNPNGVGVRPIPGGPADKPKGTGPFTGNAVDAQALNMLIANGTLTQQQAAELAAGKTITNPADGSVIFMTPTGLFSRPAGAAPAAGAPQPSAPSGMIPVTPPKPQTMTEGQANAALYADRMRAADKIIAANETSGISFGEKAKASIPGVGNYFVSEDYQKLDQARRDFINAVLRRESGAAIAESEFENANKQYFPQPGDKPEVLKQKAENRLLALDGISRAAGPAYKSPGSSAPTAPTAPAGRPPLESFGR
ncbi:hypothetical protein [uncultured Bradyrhizobium sp.]|uniref:hypothetical protein n=1 Tax=uncultured Bradyrhizobium sp. TaxID=199684 RepID=UPI0026336B51|nr:hypothetical protein [uncultured Bradyrhizobium sp.]